MKVIKLGAAALNQTPLDWEGNLQRILGAIEEARSQGVTLLCLPELAICGYGCEDAFFSSETSLRSWAALNEIVARSSGMIISVGLPVRHARSTFNTAALIADGQLLGLSAKKNLAGDGVHYEPRWFNAWPEGLRDEYLAPDGGSFPIGDLIFEVGGVRIGFEICEDAWVAQRPGARMASLGVDLILNPSASHFAFGKSKVRQGFVIEGSRAFNCCYVYANLLGNESGRVIYDGQLIIANAGAIVAESKRFGFDEIRVISTTVDLSLGRLAKAKSVSHRPKLPTHQIEELISEDFEWPVQAPALIDPPQIPELDKFEEFTLAVCLGLHDYRRKSHSSGYVVSLSGGADSSAAACLVRLMFDLARADLGESAYPSGFEKVLLTAYQGTRNSGEVTRKAAQTLAGAIECRHHELNIAELHEGYVSLVEAALGHDLNWNDHDISLQNIQARVRAPGIWMFANLRNAILLTTSNRSEAAVGYATMDGDTAGGLAPIAGIDKAFLRAWLRWMETTGPLINGKRRPIPELSVVNTQTPTAELRPQEAGQSDEDDLMPYPVLDFIERCAIRDQRSPKQIVSLLAARFSDSSEDQRKAWTRRFFQLWSRNQWKRERYAPGFHLDDANLDPKTWCRWPILSGGFQQELSEL